MKKIICSFIAIYTLGVLPGLANPARTVPTKTYVDDGLVAVYTRAKNLNAATQQNVTNLSDYIGHHSDSETGTEATGLTKQVEDLTSDIINMSYTTDHRGVVITDDRAIGIHGLDETTSTNNKVYVFKNNVAAELAIEDTWSIPQSQGN